MEGDTKILFDKLVKQRGRVKASLTRTINFVNDFKILGKDTAALQSRLSSLSDIWRKFDEVQSEIEELTDNLDSEIQENQEQERGEFEDKFYNIKSVLLSRINNETNQGPRDNIVENLQSIQAKLPKVNIQKFDGSYLNWVTFYETYKAMIHDVKGLNTVQKFGYLLGYLEGEAADLISSIELSAENYEVAWKFLCDSYKNNKLIIQSHVTSLFNYTKLDKTSSSALRDLRNTFNKHLKALRSLDQPVEYWDTLLIHLITSKFDNLTLQAWEQSTPSKEASKYKDLDQFLESRCTWLESYESKGATAKFKEIVFSKVQKDNFTKYKENKRCFVTINDKLCPICERHKHAIYNCSLFLSNSLEDRRNLIKKNKCCWNCLSQGHAVKDCKSSSCKKCSGRHNTLLCKLQCLNSPERNVESVPPPKNSLITLDDSSSNNITNNNDRRIIGSTVITTPRERQAVVGSLSLNNKVNSESTSNCISQVLIATASVYIYDNNNKPYLCRFILDSGSELNFITTHIANKMGVDIKPTNMTITGVGGNKIKATQYASVKIASRLSNYKTSVDCNILNSVLPTTMPYKGFRISNWQLPKYITNYLADPDFFKSGQHVDGLLGADVFFDILRNGRYSPLTKDKLENTKPVFINTAFGWVVSGKICFENPDPDNLICCVTTCDKIINTLEDEVCEDLFVSTHKRERDGRFTVQLPFKEDYTKIGDSLKGATQRFLNLEKRLNKQPQVKEHYVHFMEEYKTLGHMELVATDKINHTPNYYLPHHAVYKDSCTTQTRVVFDASFKALGGFSLNDYLSTGPSIQGDLFSILIRFRMHKYVLTGDICKMFRQVLVEESQCDMQRIVWRPSPELPLEHYRLLTVTYGTNCAPFLAIRCLHQLAEDISDRDSVIAGIIKNSFYMDDLMTGADTVNELCRIRAQVERVLLSGGFQLRKWCANSDELMAQLKEENRGEHFVINTNTEGTVKALGITWNPDEDNFQFNIHPYNYNNLITKPVILSDINKLWDPLGLLSPVIIKGRIFLQELWQSGLAWDEPLPWELQQKWVKYRQELSCLHGICVPRRVISHPFSSVTLHGFCDASLKALGCCIYALSKDEYGFSSSRLVCAKVRVAPSRTTTIPRLELSAALLLAQTIERLIRALSPKEVLYHCWCDSQIVLAWLAGSPQQWKPFIGNRVRQIQDVSQVGHWHHIASKDNPADLLSRGIPSSTLTKNAMWWHGPYWLISGVGQWPTTFLQEPDETQMERRKVTLSLVAIKDQWDLLNKFSSWIKLIRVMAYILRFVSNCRTGVEFQRKDESLTTDELNNAKITVVRLLQQHVFMQEWRSLIHKTQLPKGSKLSPLYPFIDQDNIIRVGGRLTNADLPESHKHPIILPYKHMVTEIILRHIHQTNQHAGPQTLLAIARLEYWPLNGKSAARSIVHGCITCRRADPRAIYPFMASLPRSRVTPARPFSVCGVDFCGPVYIKIGLRKSIKGKAYIAAFVCFVTKALHLELVSDLSTSAFLAALRRFFARRGKSAHIYSDNGTNFVGAQRELKFLFGVQQKSSSYILDVMANEGVKWHFIPPGSPHFGGLWESAVKAVKFHLKRVMGNAVLTFAEVSTLLAQIEACLNSRPLTPLSTNPLDFSFLTPGHFLIGSSLLLSPEPDLSCTPESHLKRWQLLQKMLQCFWKRWSLEYLSGLQARNKWKFQDSRNQLPVGTLVLLKEDNTPPLQWRTARIVRLHPGIDGTVRVATVKTSGAEFKRPLVKLCPLLMEDSEDGVIENQSEVEH